MRPQATIEKLLAEALARLERDRKLTERQIIYSAAVVECLKWTLFRQKESPLL